MGNESEELETKLETELGSADEAQPNESDVGDTESAAEGEVQGGNAADGADEGPKSLAEALSAGIDSVTKKGKDPAEKVPGDEKDPKDPADKKDGDGKDPAGKAKEEGTEKDKDGKGKVDHVNDPIDARLAPRTQERIRSLVDEVKVLREADQNNRIIYDAVTQTGASPEEFGAMLSYMQWTHSDKPEHLEQAYKLLQSELQGVALRLGKAIPEVDWLSGHQDLVDAVRAGATTREIAIEIAMGRADKARQKAISDAKAQKTQGEQQSAENLKQARESAMTALDALGDELAAADPQYKAKYDLIMPGLLKECKTLHPSKWEGRFRELYMKAVVKQPVAQPAAVTPAKPKGQPIRPSTPSGGTQKAPSSALDALNSALESMGK